MKRPSPRTTPPRRSPTPGIVAPQSNDPTSLNEHRTLAMTTLLRILREEQHAKAGAPRLRVLR